MLFLATCASVGAPALMYAVGGASLVQPMGAVHGLEPMRSAVSQLRTSRSLLAAVATSAAALGTEQEEEEAVVGSAALVDSIAPAYTRDPVRRPELDEWREFEELRGGMDGPKLKEFFAQRPQLVASRLLQVVTTLKSAQADWEAGEGLGAGEKSDEFDPTKDVRGEAAEEGTRGAKLCEAMASLGPVSVKLSQTLSQRPDLVGDEAATALKRLQTSNVPFADELAWAVIKEDFRWRGPIAPGVGVDAGADAELPPLFASITPSPVAVASLGQVYKAITHEGKEVAVKVQRPDAMSMLAKDYMCFVVSWAAIELWWKIVRARAMRPRGPLLCARWALRPRARATL